MPSTYSTDLRIELIAPGEQSGTWGQTTNNNLGTLIEDAISGLVTVSVISSAQALTAINGAADQARCAAIRLTTTTTADFAVYAPPVTKIYIVQNDTAYTATIYASTFLGNTTAAGAGIAIPAGKTVLVRTNGTDFLNGQDYAPAFETGDATLGNRLAGTYTQAGTTVTVTTGSPHGYVNGELVTFINVSGLTVNTTASITLINTTSFSFTGATTIATTAGNCFVTNDDVDINGRIIAGAVVQGSSSDLAALNVIQNGAGGGLLVRNTGAGNSLTVQDSTNPDDTPFVIDSGGNVIVGNAQTLSTWSNTGITPRVQQVGLTAADAGSGIAAFSATTTSAPSIELAKSSGATVGTYTALAANTTLGSIQFSGSDGTDFSPAASIAAFADGEFGTSGDTTDSPGRVVISTAPNGTDILVERLRINNAGEVIVGAGENSASTAGNTLRGPARTGTDATGVDFILQSGNGTGTGGSGALILQTAVPGTSGSTADTMVDRLRLSNGPMIGRAFNMNYGIIPVEQFYALNTAFTGSTVLTPQPFFNGPTGGGVFLAANTSYVFELNFALLNSASAGVIDHLVSIQFSIGSGTILSIGYTYVGSNSATNNTTAVRNVNVSVYSTTAAATTITTGGTGNRSIIGTAKGIVSIGTAGIWTPQYVLSASPGVAYATQVGSYVRVSPLGPSNANINSGGW